MNTIVWIASYPKSGNTWLRIFLVNYIVNADRPVSINETYKIARGDSDLNEYTAMNKGDSFDSENLEVVLDLRKRVISEIATTGASINLVKTHAPYRELFGYDLIPKQYSRSAIHIVRNPLDQVISYASHYGVSIDSAIEHCAKEDHFVGAMPGRQAITQFLGSWASHVHSWSTHDDFPVLTIRYEDMRAQTFAVFAHIINFIKLPYDEQRLKKAIRFSNFRALQKQEVINGFAENSPNQERFFRKGTSGQWKDVLTKDQIARIRSEHGAVMKQLGY